MRITQITDQIRRDFAADIVCEGCGNEEQLKGGYDDRYYHDRVLPARKCAACGMSRNDLGIEQNPTQTKYADWGVV